MDMDMSMDSSSSTNMSSSSSMMVATLFFDTDTPLYGNAWTPRTPGQFAGTCIFLVLLAVTFRGLLAAKAWKEAAWVNAEFNRRYVTVVDKISQAESIVSDANSEKMILSSNGVEENVMVVKKRSVNARPWRISVDPLRAVIDTVIAGTGYML
jgi:hypothetical protein